MKLLFFVDSLRTGGKERRVVELIKGLNSCPKVEAEVVLMDTEIHYKEILSLDIPITFLLRKSKKDISIFKKFYNHCKRSKPDIIHSWDGMTAIYSAPTAKLLKCGLVNGLITNASPKNWQQKEYLFAKFSFAFSHCIVANSKAGLVAYGVDQGKGVVIHNGYNFERQKSAISVIELKQSLNIKKKFVVGMVASNSKKKDYETFIKAARMVLEKRNDVIFVAIGSETDNGEYNYLIRDKEGDILFLGRKSDVESYVNMMDICVLSTFHEGISNAIMEYMAASKPVVATDGGGTRELVIDGETGYLIPSLNPQVLAEKILKLLSNSHLRSTMGKAGKERIIDQFSIERMVGSYLQLYNKLYN